MSHTKSLMKRGFDIVGALCLLTLFSPIMLALGLLIGLRNDGPVLFRHTRIGKNGRPFHCLKFRTMVRDADKALAAHLAASAAARIEWQTGRKLRDDPRILGATGRFLRTTSLDELPQFLNVLRGDMSLVGPRPITAEERHHYGDQLDLYLSVRPGLTGPWQVSGRSDVAYSERVLLDIQYIRSHNVLRDIAICLATAAVMLRRRGAY